MTYVAFPFPLPNNHPISSPTTSPDLSALAMLWDTPITYVKQYTDATQSISKGYFLSYFIERCEPGEWIALNQQQLTIEIGLTPKQWRNIRTGLIEDGLLLNKRTVNQSLFSLDDFALEQRLKQHAKLSPTDLYAAPLSLNRLHVRTLAAAGLSVKAFIMLALLQELGHSPLEGRLKHNWSRWAVITENMVSQRTGLSRHQQDHALKELTNIGLVEHQVCGLPASRIARYNLQRLADMTRQQVNHQHY